MLVPGIIHDTGEPDVGKTTFALECGALPDRIWFLEDDVKGRATVQELMAAGHRFGRYDDLVALAKDKRELEFHQACLDLKAEVKPGQFDVIIWDTWTRFAKTCHPYVLANPAAFRQRWSAYGKIKGAQQWQEAHFYEAQILSELQKLAPTVIVVTHLKDFYLNDAKTGKQVPACSRTLVRVPRFRIWLRHNENSPVPIGLVLKRLDKKIVTEKGLRTVSILPRKIVPMDGHRSLWDTIAWYHKNPVGLREPTPQETPNEYELSILDSTLTADQKRTLELMLRAGAVSSESSEPETEQIDPDVLERIKSLKADGETLSAIAGKVGMGAGGVARALREAR